MTRQGRVSHTVRASWWALWRQVNPELNPGVDLYLQIQEQARLYCFFFFLFLACSHSDDIHAQSLSACLCTCLCHCSKHRLSSLLRKVWTYHHHRSCEPLPQITLSQRPLLAAILPFQVSDSK